MLKLRADFHYKNKYIITQNCVVEKMIRLSGEQFDTFAANLLKDYDFIRENQDCIHFGNDGIFHCLLVTGEDRKDGVLVRSEGYDYARYAAYVSDVHTIAAAQSPALTALGEKLSGLVEHLADEYLQLLEKDDRVELPIFDEAEAYGVDISGSDILRETVVEMLGERLEEHDLDMELDKDELILTPREQDMQMGM